MVEWWDVVILEDWERKRPWPAQTDKLRAAVRTPDLPHTEQESQYFDRYEHSDSDGDHDELLRPSGMWRSVVW
jgi:hypothetical protein